jgi:hypothetical protein
MAVADNINNLQKDVNFTTSFHLATLDVESLFTRIPQDRLLQIITDEIDKVFETSSEKETFISFLKIIIQCNTFQIHDNYCLQKIGLPMGGPLSGTLANIYLGYIENTFVKLPNLYLYNRYMDDILLITSFTDIEMQNFITFLQTTFQLTITASSNNKSVNFLDMTISLSASKKQFIIHPYSKRRLHYPLPSADMQRGYNLDSNIIKSQILRTYRFSNDDHNFTKSINKYLEHLLSNKYHRRLRKSIFQFLLPLKKSTHRWSTDIPICSSCLNIITINSIVLLKIIKIDKKYLGIKFPINCNSQNISIMYKDEHSYHLTWIPSLHHYFHTNLTSTSIHILPLGFLSIPKQKSLLTKFPVIQSSNKDNVMKMNSTHPCHIHPIFKRPSKVYGVPTARKKTLTFGSFFNDYKKMTRRRTFHQ